MNDSYDYVIAGAGIVGLTVARELATRKAGKILVLEKEPEVGKHASGRNSGVIHAGVYYASDSLKAKFCTDGSKRLLAYAEENKLPLLKCGKVIVATKPETVATLATLHERANKNGVTVHKITLDELKKLEPQAKSYEYALHSPNSAVIDSHSVLDQLLTDLNQLGVDVVYHQEVHNIDPKTKTVYTANTTVNYGYFINAAGVYADRLAHLFGVGLNYRILPFKGLYWKATRAFADKIKGLIYPAPDLSMPFLGVHITKTVTGDVLFGPTAIPAFGRENYSLLGGLDLLESPVIITHLLGMLIRNPANFRKYVREELGRYVPRNFFNETKSLVHEIQRQDIAQFYKVGIRPQLMDLDKKQLENDFVLRAGDHSMHVLNAISPAFTSALSFAVYLADEILESPAGIATR
jgi:L-2-hydroxyglutarate oxidase